LRNWNGAILSIPATFDSSFSGGIVSKLTRSLLIRTTTTQRLPVATWALLKVAREHVQKSSKNSAVGTRIADGLVVIALLITASYARVIASGNAKALDGLRTLELRVLEVVFFHGFPQTIVWPRGSTRL
jgi:hypothetical protein